MSILRARQRWERPRRSGRRERAVLTPEEQGHVAAALRVLQRRLGSTAALAVAMGCTFATLRTVTYAVGSRRIGPGLALRAAKVAGVPVEDVLSGAWPKAGACPMCGRCGDLPKG